MAFNPNASEQGYPPEREPMVDTKTGKITRPWFLFTQTVNQVVSLFNSITNLTNVTNLSENPPNVNLSPIWAALATLLAKRVSPTWRLYKTQAQAISLATLTRLVWENKVTDTHSFFDGTSKVTIPETAPGTYLIMCHVKGPAGTIGDDIEVQIQVNGKVVAHACEAVTWIGQFVAGDVIEAFAYVIEHGTEPATITAVPATGFEGFQLSASTSAEVGGIGGSGGVGDSGDGEAPEPFPPDYAWCASRIYEGATAVGIGQAVPGMTFASVSAQNDTIGFGRRLNTSAVAGNGAGINSASQLTMAQCDPTWTCVMRTGLSIADVRIWVLLMNGATSDVDEFAAARNYMGFRFSTVVGDPGWVGVTKDGTTQAVTAKVADIAADTIYKLKVRKSGNNLYFSVNDGAELNHTLNLPSATSQLSWYAFVYTQAGATKSLVFYHEHLRHGVSA